MEDCSILGNVIEFDGRLLNFSGDKKKNIIVHNLDIKKLFSAKHKRSSSEDVTKRSRQMGGLSWYGLSWVECECRFLQRKKREVRSIDIDHFTPSSYLCNNGSILMPFYHSVITL